MSKLRLECVPFKDLSVEKLYELLALRQKVFVVEQNCVFQDADNKDQEATHCLAYDESGILVACTRLFDSEVYYGGYQSIGRVSASIENRGKGYGREIFDFSLVKLEELYGKKPVMIGAQKYLEKFYNSFGFITAGQPYIEDDIWHVIMVLER
jgi:ElaA protein